MNQSILISNWQFRNKWLPMSQGLKCNGCKPREVSLRRTVPPLDRKKSIWLTDGLANLNPSFFLYNIQKGPGGMDICIRTGKPESIFRKALLVILKNW